jgi:sortase A
VFVSAENGPLWVLTDLATARALGMTPVSIENANGEFVAPTEESMRAAVSTMTLNESGALVPDPSAPAGAGTTGGVGAQANVPAYPLTFVQYAMTPAEPLIDTSTCTARADSQALLSNWLNYVIGPGQEKLAAGLVALPDSLKTQAQQSLTRVGASPVTGPCAGQVTIPGSPAPTGAAGGLGVGAIGGPGALGNPTRTAGVGTALPTGAGAAAASASGAASDRDRVAVPAFAGHALPDTSGGVIALIGIVLVTSLAAWLTAGRGIGAPAMAGAGGGGAVTRPPIGGLVLLWVGVAATGVGLVVYQLGPLLEQQEQHELISEFKTTARQAAAAGGGLPSGAATAKAPEPGSSVGVVEIGDLKIQAVVVEGAGAAQTSRGPGHVAGTAGLGQPGNSVVVARRNGYGGTFQNLAELEKGARILVTTTQGQSVYRVSSVREVALEDAGDDEGSALPSASASDPQYDEKRSSTVSVDTLYGPTEDDRLTLVTSSSRAFWNSSDAVVVTAKMRGEPFEPTPQNGRTDEASGRTGDTNAWPTIALSLLLYGGAIAVSVLLYQRMRFRVAYILTVAPLVALTVVVGENLSRLLPAWT